MAAPLSHQTRCRPPGSRSCSGHLRRGRLRRGGHEAAATQLGGGSRRRCAQPAHWTDPTHAFAACSSLRNRGIWLARQPVLDNTAPFADDAPRKPRGPAQAQLMVPSASNTHPRSLQAARGPPEPETETSACCLPGPCTWTATEVLRSRTETCKSRQADGRGGWGLARPALAPPPLHVGSAAGQAMGHGCPSGASKGSFEG